MNVFLLGVSALAGEQIIELVEDNPLTESVVLKLFDSEDNSGQSLMVGGTAKRVNPYATADFSEADLVVLCAPEIPGDLIAKAIEQSSVLDLHAHAATENGSLLVAEINAGDLVVEPGAVYRSPEPALLVTALLLHALAPTRIQPLRVTANLICPASLHDQAGIQALATETAHLLNGREAPEKLFDASLAFNLLATPQQADADGEMAIERMFKEGVVELIDEGLEVAVTAVEAPLFHGTAVALIIEARNRADLQQLIQVVDRHPKLRYTQAKSASTQSVTGVDQCLVSRLRLDADDDLIIKTTLLLDEQRLGRASNAVALLGSLTIKH